MPAKKETPKGAAAALRITAKRDGFRRAGRAWPATPTTVPLDALSEEQVELLRSETMLVVEDVEIEAAPES